jgi:hypothetical protein
MKITYVYDPIRVHRSMKGPCVVCGRQATRSRTFQQMLNPFNKRPDGQVKTVEEIYAELREEADRWLTEPLTHERCERTGP